MATRRRFERATDIEGDREARRQISSLRDRRRGYVRTGQGPTDVGGQVANKVLGNVQGKLKEQLYDQDKEVKLTEELQEDTLINSLARNEKDIWDAYVSEAVGRNAPKAREFAYENFKKGVENSTKNLSPEDLKRLQPLIDRTREKFEFGVTQHSRRELEKVAKVESTQALTHIADQTARVSGTALDADRLLEDGKTEKSEFNIAMTRLQDKAFIHATRLLGLTSDDANIFANKVSSKAVLDSIKYQIKNGQYGVAKEVFETYMKPQEDSLLNNPTRHNIFMTAEDRNRAKDMLKAGEELEKQDKAHMLAGEMIKLGNYKNKVEIRKVARGLSKGDSKLYKMIVGEVDDYANAEDNRKVESRKHQNATIIGEFISASEKGTLSQNHWQTAVGMMLENPDTEDNDFIKAKRVFDMLRSGDLQKVQSDPNVFAHYLKLASVDKERFLKDTNFRQLQMENPKLLSETDIKMFIGMQKMLAMKTSSAGMSSIVSSWIDRASRIKDAGARADIFKRAMDLGQDPQRMAKKEELISMENMLTDATTAQRGILGKIFKAETPNIGLNQIPIVGMLVDIPLKVGVGVYQAIKGSFDNDEDLAMARDINAMWRYRAAQPILESGDDEMIRNLHMTYARFKERANGREPSPKEMEHAIRYILEHKKSRKASGV